MFSVHVENKQVIEALRRARSADANMRGIYKAIGEYMIKSTLERFERGGPAPDGKPWAPLKPSTLARKKTTQILVESRHLRDSIRYRADNTKVEIGTKVKYAAIHQFGGRTSPTIIKPRRKKALWWPGAPHPVKSVRHPGVAIPARPYLGVDKDDAQEIEDIVAHYIRRAILGR